MKKTLIALSAIALHIVIFVVAAPLIALFFGFCYGAIEAWDYFVSVFDALKGIIKYEWTGQ